MRVNRLLFAQAVLVAGIAVGTAGAWLHLTSARHLTPGAVIVCAFASVVAALLVEEVVRRVRRGRPRRAHARPAQPKEPAR